MKKNLKMMEWAKDLFQFAGVLLEKAILKL